MGELAELIPLKNRYFILRHGESEANLTEMITSDPAQCTTSYGLTERGRQQVTTTIRTAKMRGWLDDKTIIYSSDFLRAVETAEIARTLLHASAVHTSQALRERFFGDYDGKRVDAYIEIWARDQVEERSQEQHGVEGADEILDRLLNFLKELEARHAHACMLLVSHGDPLQVLQVAFEGLLPGQHQLLKYIKPAEIRELEPKVRRIDAL